MSRDASDRPPERHSRKSLEADRQPREQPAELIAGRYRVLSPLGQGGMASVWSVHDQVTGRNLALKRLLKNAAAAHVTLFEREYHTLATLNHPCIVGVFDYAADD